ncbi:hypothetical protein STEG23_031205 [Scotinomys teguina]
MSLDLPGLLTVESSKCTDEPLEELITSKAKRGPLGGLRRKARPSVPFSFAFFKDPITGVLQCSLLIDLFYLTVFI